ncbi:hypothetical protein TNCV_1726781 [Trichonephila clavipes]|nr:hypothetical protein TNCV_1726781 [Trichonephila clavipes]
MPRNFGPLLGDTVNFPAGANSSNSRSASAKTSRCVKIREVAEDSMKNAAKEEVSASGSNEIRVNGDGTWKTCGHTSRIGVCSVIGDVTGKE